MDVRGDYSLDYDISLVREGSKRMRKIKGSEKEAGLMDYRC